MSFILQLQVGNRIRAAVQALGTSCIDLVQDAGSLQSNPADSFAKKGISDHARKVSEKVLLHGTIVCGNLMSRRVALVVIRHCLP